MAFIPNIIKSWNIYKMTSPTDRVYVGLTSDLPKRKRNYRRADCKSQVLLYKSLNKYGFDNLNFEIIDEFDGTASEARSKEIFWIRSCMSNFNKYPNQNGLNLTNGGQGTSGRKMSEENKKYLSNLYKGVAFFAGHKHTEEAKASMSKNKKGKESPHKGKKITLELCLKNSEGQKNKIFSLKGKKLSEETKARLRENRKSTCKKPILLISDNETLEFSSIRKSSLFLGIGTALIKRIIEGFNDNKFNNYTIKYK